MYNPWDYFFIDLGVGSLPIKIILVNLPVKLPVNLPIFANFLITSKVPPLDFEFLKWVFEVADHEYDIILEKVLEKKDKFSKKK